MLRSASDWPGGGALGSAPAGPHPPKAGPEDSQLERVKPGKSSWKGAGPDQLGSQLRAGGALGCHKVNGRRRGVAVRGESHALPELLSPGAPERSGGPGAGGQPPSRPGVRPLALACPPDYGRRRHRRCRESACCGTHCECLTTAGTRAQGVKGPWLDFGVPKTGLGSAELENGTWGTGRNWEGGLQTQGQDLGKGKFRVRTWRTERGGEVRGTRREAGDMKPGQGLREAGSRDSRVTITRKHPRIRGRGADSQGAKGVAEALASGGSWQRLPSVGAVGGVQRPSPGAQLGLQGLGVGVRLVAHASLFSCFAVALRAL